jgi:hypothetical protein
LVIVTAAGDAAGEMVAEHVLVAQGEASILDEHYGGPRPAPRRAVRPKTVAGQQFCVPVAAEGFPGLFVHGRHVRDDPGVEDEQAGAVLGDHLLRKGFVAGVAAPE